MIVEPCTIMTVEEVEKKYDWVDGPISSSAELWATVRAMRIDLLKAARLVEGGKK
jgi:hypothetical protein